MSGSELAQHPPSTDGEPPSKRARLEGSTTVLDSREPSHVPSSKFDGNTPPVPVSDVEDDPYSLDATASAYEHKASDLYLDTVRHHAPSTPDTPSYSSQINRALLDFDFEKVCSVSTSNINVYGCLVCGKYFQGRGRSSYAYAHSIHDDHHVFMHLETSKVNFIPCTCRGDLPSGSSRSTYSQMAISSLTRPLKILLSC